MRDALNMALDEELARDERVSSLPISDVLANILSSIGDRYDAICFRSGSGSFVSGYYGSRSES